MTITDPEQFIAKNKLVTYTRAFIELYKLRKHGQVYEIYGIVKLEKWRASTAKILVILVSIVL